MGKKIAMFLICLAIIGNLCVADASAAEIEMQSVSSISVESRATKSFTMVVSPYGKSVAGEVFYLEAGETVRIYATYSPRDESISVGLVDSDNTFYYFSPSDGVVDITLSIEIGGEYRFLVKNNSSYMVSISGYVNY